MKIYGKLIPAIARDIVQALVQHRDIEVEESNLPAAQQDFEAVLKEYVRAEKELSSAAEEILVTREWSSNEYVKAKRIAAEVRRIPLGDEALEYLTNQMLECMFISPHIAEVFSEDHVMRKRMIDIIKRYLRLNEEVDEEVRRRLKHLQEGTRDWEIAYQKTLEQVRRAKNLI